MNGNLIKDVVKGTTLTKVVFDDDTSLVVNGANVGWDNEGSEQVIRIYPISKEPYAELRVLYSSATLNKQGTSTAAELVDYWETNSFFF